MNLLRTMRLFVWAVLLTTCARAPGPSAVSAGRGQACLTAMTDDDEAGMEATA
jgi:hypothetical protein